MSATKVMKAYELYFTERALLDTLAGMRLRCAANRHKLHMLWELSSGVPAPDTAGDQALCALLPPRRQWGRLNRAGRRRSSPDTAARRGIVLTAERNLHSQDSSAHPWASPLRALIHRIQEQAQNPRGTPLAPPLVRLHPKPNGGFRVIATYDDLATRVFLKQAARYIRDAADPWLSNSVYAFRRRGGPSRNDAVRELLLYRQAHSGRDLFVAECDIASFFDTVPASAVRSALHRLEARLSRGSQPLAPQARALVEMYLESYDLIGSLHELKRDPSISASALSALEDLLAALKEHQSGPTASRAGLPQGGALSPVLANLVMEEADRAAMGATKDRGLFYARYCDDMLIAHPDRSQCEQAFQRYLAALQELRLPVHRPVQEVGSGPAYYTCKSKAPFRWANPAPGSNAVPWVGFLGYQFRFDGRMRIRRASCQTHVRKQAHMIRLFMNLVSDPERVQALRGRDSDAGPRLVSRAAQYLVSSSVGAAKPIGVSRPGGGRCWIDAFAHIDANPHSMSQLRWLDRSRTQLIRRLSRWVLRAVPSPQHDAPQHPARRTPHPPARRTFFGYPFSYYGTLFGARSGRRRPGKPAVFSYPF